ncbi:MAG TPA: hypothetical protein VF614_12155 [Chthoniobacteraceae bacterium]
MACLAAARRWLDDAHVGMVALAGVWGWDCVWLSRIFCGGLAFRTVERRHSGDAPPEEVLALESGGSADDIATDTEKGPSHMARAVLAGLAGSGRAATQRGLVSWFGIRGIGSPYCLAYAVNRGLSPRSPGS